MVYYKYTAVILMKKCYFLIQILTGTEINTYGFKTPCKIEVVFK